MNASALPALPARTPQLKLALLLGAAGVLATLALFPYLSALLPMPASRLPPRAMAIAAAVQSGVLAWLAAWLGLFLGSRHGLDASWLRAWVYRRPWPPARRAHWAWAVALGVAAGLMVPALDRLGGHPAAAPPALGAAGLAWRGALASFYGGIVEETLCRLLLVSLLVWALAKANRDRARPWMFVAAIVLGALLFGAGHLPAAFAGHLVDGPAAIARIVLLNASVAVVFGAVFWRWGLEHAMLAHFAADLVLHVALPLLGQGG